jgi:hypothetical protein
MDKTERKRDADSTKSLKNEVEKATSNPGTDGHDERVWVRDDGAVCFGDECVVIKTGKDGTLDLTIQPDACGPTAGSAILEHLIKSAGKGVHIIVPPSEVKTEAKKS